MSHGTARRFLFVLVFHSSLANIAGWNAVSAQETVKNEPSQDVTSEVKGSDTAVRDLAVLRAEAEAELDKYHSENQQKLIVRLYREILTHPENDGQDLVNDLTDALHLFSDEEQLDEIVDLCELAVVSHPGDWRVRHAIAGEDWTDSFGIHWDSSGHKIGEQIHRGYDYDSEHPIQASFAARDRVWHLQLLLEAMKLIGEDPTATSKEKADLYETLATTVSDSLSYKEQNLDELTDLSRLPDPVVDDNWDWDYTPGSIQLDEKGQPVGFRVPKSWQEARSDRERWHWALEKAAQADPQRRSRLELRWIAHVDEMVGISASFPERSDIVTLGRSASRNSPAQSFSKADIRALPDSDTFIQTANGPKRVTLDDEINPFVLLQRIIDRKDADELVDAMRAMTQLRITRHQLSKAANQLDGYVNDLNGVLRDLPFNTTPNVFRSGRKQMNAVIDQLLSHRVSIKPRNESEPIETNGSQWKSHSLELSFRNATSTTFRLMPVDLEKIIETKLAGAFPAPEEPNAQSDPRQYILSILLTGVGRLTDVHREGLIKEQLIGPVAKEWTVALKPLPEHELTSEEIDVQVDDPSKLWLLTAGNGDTIDDSWLLWQAPAEFVIKPMKDKSHVGFLADRLTGKGIGNTEIDVCHFEEKMFQKSWKEFGTTLSTDENGLFRIPKGKTLNGLMVCRKDGHVLALGKIFDRTEHFGRDPVQTDLQMQLEQEPRAFIVTDRSIYRPGDTVRFHFWIRKAFGELSLIPDLAECSVTITDISEYSESETFFAKGQHDARKGFTSEWKIPIDVKLGDYQLEPRISGLRLSQSSSFRIEEYRRPEFRVTVTTTGHSAATDQQEITVEARYLFGKPLPSGSVKWKLIYQDEPEMQYPVERWDGLYGNGYAWDFAAASRPQMHLRGLGGRGGGMGFFSIPPNGGNSRLASSESETGERRLIMSGKSVLDADGKCVFQLNSVSKLLDRGVNHLEVQVVDATRRMETATLSLSNSSGTNLFVKTDRSFCKRDDKIQISVGTLDLNGMPVERDCQIEVLDQRDDDADQVRDNASQKLQARTGTNGLATIPVTLQRTGPVRIRASLVDDPSVSQENTVIVLPDDNKTDLPFQEVDLRVERVENMEGTSAKLLISGPTADATVLLFVRSRYGLVEMPTIISLNGHASVVPIELNRDDCPQTHVEAVFMGNGTLHQEAKKILVPPVAQRLEVQLTVPDRPVKPGEEALLTLGLRDSHDVPASANVLVAAYDQSLDQLATPLVKDMIQTFYGRNIWHSELGQRSRQGGFRENEDSAVQGDDQLGPQFLGDYSFRGQQNFGGYEGGFGSGGGVFGAGGGLGGGFGGGGGALGGGGFSGGGQGGSGLGGGGLGGNAMPDTVDPIQSLAAVTGPYVDPRLRANWKDTAFFSADLETDEKGQLTVRIPLPDNLTTWKVRAWAIDKDVRVGYAERSLQTSQSIMIRPHVPRHFTNGDRVTLSAAIYSSLDAVKLCRVSLKSANGYLKVIDPASQDIKLAPNAETVVHWTVEASSFGDAELSFSAQTDAHADAARITIPVNPRGEWQNLTRFASIKDASPSTKFTFEIPADRLAEKATLDLQWGNSVADSVLDALPFLIEYPHGCAEQTTNKFVPLALAHNAANQFPQLRFSPTGAMVDGASNKPGRQLPDEATFRKMLNGGRNRLSELQNADGGWGWFGSAETSNLDLTAQVVYGLFLSMDQDVGFTDSHVAGVHYLTKLLTSRRQTLADPTAAHRAGDSDAFLVFVISQIEPVADFDLGDEPLKSCREILAAMNRDADSLSPLGIMLAGLAAQSLNEADLVDQFVARADKLVIRDEVTQTIRIDGQKVRRGGWFESSTEALGRYLQLKLRGNSEDPDLDWIRRGLLMDRRASMSWENTRDTAVVIEALLELLKTQNNSVDPPSFEIWLDGKLVQKIDGTADREQPKNRFSMNAAKISTGMHELEIRRLSGSDFETMLVSREFSTATKAPTADDARPLMIERRFYKKNPLPPSAETPDGTAGDKDAPDERIPLTEQDTIKAGDVIEVELRVMSREDLEYLMIQNPHAAGFEVSHLPDRFRNATHHELRDDRVDIYVDFLAAGTYTFSYQLRAEHSGVLWNNPARIASMYFEQISASSGTSRTQCE